MHRYDHKRKDVARHASTELVVGLFKLVDPNPGQSQTQLGRSLRGRQRELVSRRIGGSPIFDTKGGGQQQLEESTADDQGENPVGTARLHGHKTLLCGEHDAENQQHERSADIDH